MALRWKRCRTGGCDFASFGPHEHAGTRRPGFDVVLIRLKSGPRLVAHVYWQTARDQKAHTGWTFTSHDPKVLDDKVIEFVKLAAKREIVIRNQEAIREINSFLRQLGVGGTVVVSTQVKDI